MFVMLMLYNSVDRFVCSWNRTYVMYFHYSIRLNLFKDLLSQSIFNMLGLSLFVRIIRCKFFRNTLIFLNINFTSDYFSLPCHLSCSLFLFANLSVHICVYFSLLILQISLSFESFHSLPLSPVLNNADTIVC